jgi:DNA-binding MarR family transcriptional regulator
MASASSRPPLAGRRRRLATEIRDHLRELNSQLALLNQTVGAQVRLKEGDLACLDLIQRRGPITPSALARAAGLHPATMTGVLDRLQRDGWIVRERDPAAADRRAVSVRLVPERAAHLFALYGGMTQALDDLCRGYSATELALLRDFLERVTRAGEAASAALVETPPDRKVHQR